jgi:hypothetical protein
VVLTVPVSPFLDIDRVPDPRCWKGGLPLRDNQPEIQDKLLGPPVTERSKFLVFFRLTLWVEPESFTCATTKKGLAPIGLPVALLVATP